MTTAAIGAPAEALARPTALPIYFGEPRYRCFGWYHEPQGDSPRAAVVVCPPLGHEAIYAHRALRHMAERLAVAGHPVLRLDYHGTGDSPGGEMSPALVEAWLASIAAAAAEVRARAGTQRVVLVGLRAGALLALAGAPGAAADALVLWAPVVSGRAYVRELRALARMNPRRDDESGLPEGAVESGGFVFAADTLRALAELDPLAVTNAPAHRALIVDRDDLAGDARLAAHLRARGVAVTERAARGFAAAVAEPHKTEVPDDVIAAVEGWIATDREAPGAALRRTDGPAVLALPPHPVPRDIAADTPRHAVIETPMRFGDDERLFGILAAPARDSLPARAGRVAVILSNAGAVYRVGPNRMYVELARACATLGLPVLRLDIGGLGDSVRSADVPENHTYSPQAVADIGAAMDALRERFGIERVILAGLCSGAHASFHAARALCGDPRVAELMLINPIVFYWKPTDSLDVSAWQVASESRRYKNTARSLTAWGRLLRGEVDVAFAARVLGRRLLHVMDGRFAELRALVSPTVERPENPAADLARIHGGGAVVHLVFGADEPGLDLLRLHHRRALARLARQRDFVLRIVSGADHTFSTYAPREQLVGELVEHLARRWVRVAR